MRWRRTGRANRGLPAQTRTLAIERARYGVCVNAIVPGVFAQR